MKALSNFLNFRINFWFNIIYIIEMVLKIIALSPKGYISDGLNIMDGLIVIISVVEISNYLI